MKISKNFEFVVDFYRLCLVCFPDEKRPFLQKIVNKLEDLKNNSKTDDVLTDDWISMLENIGISDDFKRLSGDLKYSENCLSSKNSSKRKDATGENHFWMHHFGCKIFFWIHILDVSFFLNAYFGCKFLATWMLLHYLSSTVTEKCLRLQNAATIIYNFITTFFHCEGSVQTQNIFR